MRPAAFSIILFLPLVFAINFSLPGNITSGGTSTISWTSSSTDPGTFSMELVNPNQFHNAIAIANNVPTTSGSITVTIPIVPAGDGYTIEAVDISNINSVLGTSGDFSIGATVTTASSSSSSTSPSSSTSSSSGPVTTTAPSRSIASSTGFGVTATTSIPSSSSRSSSGTSSSSTTSSSSFNGNGAPGSNIGSGVGSSIAVAVVGVIAGAIFV